MLKRKTENILLEWKNRDDKKTLIVKGKLDISPFSGIMAAMSYSVLSTMPMVATLIGAPLISLHISLRRI